MCFQDGNFTFSSFFACFSRIKDKCGLIDFGVKEERSFGFVFKSLFLQKIQKQGIWGFYKSLFSLKWENHKVRTKMSDLEVFLYGFCYFDAISTKAIERGLRDCFT